MYTVRRGDYEISLDKDTYVMYFRRVSEGGVFYEIVDYKMDGSSIIINNDSSNQCPIDETLRISPDDRDKISNMLHELLDKFPEKFI